MATKKTKSEVAEVKAEIEPMPKEEAKPQPESDEKVWIMIPYVEGDDPEETVIINGYITKIRKGRQVQVSKAVASILQRKNRQMMIALENQRKMQNQHQDW
jgi:hypothetical protein